MKVEDNFMGVTVVHDDSFRIDTPRTFLLNCIMLYAQQKNRRLKIVFFNQESGSEMSVSFFFYRKDEDGADLEPIV